MKKIKISRFVSLLLLLMVFILSCDKETCCDNPPLENIFTPPSQDDFFLIRNDALENLIQRESFSATEPIEFMPLNETVVFINANCLTTATGEPVFGEVSLEFIEWYRKDEMLMPNKPTMGLTEMGEKAMLESGGVFSLNIFQNGEELVSTCPIQLIVPGSLTGGADQQMTLWTGAINNELNLTWELNLNGEIFVQVDNYFASFQEFGWISIAQFFDSPNPKTSLQVLVSEGYTMQNASVYLSFDGVQNGLVQLDSFNPSTNMFSENYSQLPVGLDAHLIFVSTENNLWRYAIKPITISENQTYTFAHSETQTATSADLKAILSSLP